MRAGPMRYKLEILQPVKTTDRYGGESVSDWSAQATVWAERVTFSGRRSEELGEHFPDYSAKFRIRDAHTVDENWRVRQLGGHLYTVTNIEPDIYHGMLTLTCERVNE